MEYIKATENDTEEILTIVQDTIRTIYPRYYPQEVVEFFCSLHCRENIAGDIKDGLVGVLPQISASINYNGRFFVPQENTENNEQKQVWVGVCHSVPRVLDNGKIELSEKWQWLNGDQSEGESVIVER